ncbi:M1 family metallopeptidase [Cellulophaga sp. Hel_I_12]|uniref:M1 family metallopeptidase n=1 Tax=Cellulophaga sp. Hel_I_12 TaxID=1249972 RepID=UPI000647FD35|nr:M1 family metallopeptidase [Cellulophaga sp. Hel_I_12]
MTRNLLLLLFFIVFPKATLIAQIQGEVDFESAKISLEIAPVEKKISGTVAYNFKVLNAVDSIFLDAKQMKFVSVHCNGKKIKYKNSGEQIIIYKKFKKGSDHSLTIQYTAIPEQTVYFVGYDDVVQGNEQIWTQGQGKYSSHWVPSFDDVNEKVEFDITITFDARYHIISNGKLIASTPNNNQTTTWSFDMQKPMSSYLLAFAIGNYTKDTIQSTSGIPIELYHYPQDSLKVEPTYRFTKTMFDFLETEIGVPYPWQNYKQIPVKDFLYAGMENTTATIFSDAFVIDSVAFTDKNYVNVNAHELAHQWFGDMITAVDGNHHWLQEGFATYYALLAEKEIFGDDYFYWKLYETAEQLYVLSEEGKGEALMNAKASSLTFYQKGAWALVLLRNEIGEKAFKNGIKNYLEKYKFKNVTTQNFIFEMEQASGMDFSNFTSEWLISTRFPISKVISFLTINAKSLASYFELKETEQKKLDEHEQLKLIEDIYHETRSTALKRQLILDYFPLFSEDFVLKIIASKDLQIRQALLLSTEQISENLRGAYESLLSDKSYITVEAALFKLWASFPEHQKKYLDNTQAVIGFPDKNVRLIWLTLAIATPNYNGLKTKEYFDELSAYTNSEFSIETRQTAFSYLHQTLGLTDTNLKDLAKAAMHHSWQFRKFARNLIEEILKDTDYKNRFTALITTLNLEEQRYIKSKL